MIQCCTVGVLQASRMARSMALCDLTGFLRLEWISASRLIDVRDVVIIVFLADETDGRLLEVCVAVSWDIHKTTSRRFA